MILPIRDLPDELLCHIAGYLPANEQLNLTTVCHSFNDCLNSNYFDLNAARQTHFQECLQSDNYMLTSEGKHLKVITREGFFKKASFFKLCSYYLGFNDLSVLQILHAQREANPQIDLSLKLKKLLEQKNRRVDNLANASSPEYIYDFPVQLGSSLYVSGKIENYLESFRASADTHRYISIEAKVSDNMAFLYNLLPINDLYYGATVSNKEFLEFGSLKGRAICLFNATYYLTTSALLSIIITVGQIAFNTFAIGYSISAAYDQSVNNQSNHAIDTIVFGPVLVTFGMLMIESAVFLVHIATLVKALAGAILHPALFLNEDLQNVNLQRNLPNWILGV